jgi:imidazole glycerol-phosphate synthase subunit HisH
MRVVIIRYPAGNVRSVALALQRCGVQSELTDDPERIRTADKVILPGVGEASSAMAFLRSHGLDKVVLDLKQPVLGICLGLQLLCRHSEEGETQGLGIFDSAVRRFTGPGKVPQVGWNTIDGLRGPLFRDVPNSSHVYFVHGYRADLSSDTIAITNYGEPYSAALSRDNFHAVQFHPERSSAVGARILANFLALP